MARKKDADGFKLVKVTWADHFATETNMPYTVEELIAKLVPCVRITIGYLTAENRRVMAVSGTKEEDGSFTETTFLMKRCVIKCEEL